MIYFADPDKGGGTYTSFDTLPEYTTPAAAAQSANGGTAISPSFLSVINFVLQVH